MAGPGNVIKIKGKRGFSLEVEGVGPILSKMKLMKDQKQRLRKFLTEEARKIEGTARKLVPVLTGRLRDSHRVLTNKVSDQEVSVKIIAGGISVRGKFVNYAAAVHQGNPRHPEARPWLAAAIGAHAPGFLGRMKSAVKF